MTARREVVDAVLRTIETHPGAHRSTNDPTRWIACHYPERPATSDTVFDALCPACHIAFMADLALNPSACVLVSDKRVVTSNAELADALTELETAGLFGVYR